MSALEARPPRGRTLLGRAAATSFIRACAAACVAAADPVLRPADYAARSWPHDRDVGIVHKAATRGSTTASSSGGIGSDCGMHFDDRAAEVVGATARPGAKQIIQEYDLG
jgi:hypothetical protein